MRAILLGLALLLPACSRTACRHYATFEVAPSWKQDDIGESGLPDSRLGEKPYLYRGRVGWEGRWANGVETYTKIGPENKHVFEVEAGVKVPLN